jgi:hypothetical protein
VTDDPPGQLDPDPVFSILGNELRVQILLELYDAAREGRLGEDSIPYSGLQTAVGEADSGRFNYHLEKLCGHFVRKTDSGYKICEPGRAVARLLSKGTLTETTTFGPTRTDARCHLCGGTVRVAYVDQNLVVTCGDCSGVFSTSHDGGMLASIAVPPAALRGRTPTELLSLTVCQFEHGMAMMGDGFCAECCGHVETELRVCEDHEPVDTEEWDGSAPEEGDLCENCGRVIPVIAAANCQSCDRRRLGPPILAVGDTVIARRTLDGRVSDDGWERFAAIRWLSDGLGRTDDEWFLQYSTPDGGSFRVDGSLSVRGDE